MVALKEKKAKKQHISLREKIKSKTAVIGVIGMGYIGLSLLEAFGKAGFPLVGYDYNRKRVDMLKHQQSYLNFMDLRDLFALLRVKRFKPSADAAILKEADVLVICVPTTLDRYHVPDLSNLRAAFSTVCSLLREDQLVILQSSTYPGTTEEELLPMLEKLDFKVGQDVYLAHIPEVADIGNPKFSFTQVPRIVSGVTPACLEMAKALYETMGCTIVPCSSTRVAEAAKILQNAFRLVNISFINEMKILFDSMGIDVWEVIEAASSKPFGLMPFYPGPGIGGDCIPVVPFYLVWKAKLTEGPTTMLEQAGRIEALMPMYVVNKIVQALNEQKKTIRETKILILGVGYKKDVNDYRESASLKIIPMLKKMSAEVDYHDPYVPEMRGCFEDYPHLHLKSIDFDYDILHLYDAVVIITDHSWYNWNKIVANSKLIVDSRNATAQVKGFKKKIYKA